FIMKTAIVQLALHPFPTRRSSDLGASEVVIDGEDSEYEIWADDLHELLSQLKALPVFVGGSSSGCRTSLLFALRHPEAVRGLMLDRKSTRLNSSHLGISYAVFCLK